MKSVIKKIILIISLALLATLLGGLIGAVSAELLHFIEWGQHLLWEEFTRSLPLQTLLVATLGGVLIGLCQRYLGDHPKGINEAVSEISETGRLDYAHLPQGMLTASTSLIFGASLGPEAAIMDVMGGMGTWAGDVMRSFRKRFDLPEPEKSKNWIKNFIQKWPTIIAYLAGGFAFVKLLDGLYGGGLLDLSAHAFHWTDLLWSIPLGLVGAAGGWLYLKLHQWLKKWIAPLKQKPILRGTLGGFSLGLTALFLPFVLFSGQHLLNPMFEQAAQLGFWVLLLTGLARLLLTSLMLNTGWKGGQFLPIMFGGAALGLSISALLPAIPASVAALAAMGALTAVVLPKPLIALVLMGLMFPLEYIGISIVSVGTVILWKSITNRLHMSEREKTEIVFASD
ncbi:MAG: chloride channel protein [Chloroflexi bacterium]|nr:chloride channel protein [Chloroflexota bacterium]